MFQPYRTLAIIERDMRKFFRSPTLMISSMVFPLLQLIVLGYAFGGKVKNVRLALVDEDRGSEAWRIREQLSAIENGPKTFRVIRYDDIREALTDLKAGFVRGIVHIPNDYSRRVLHRNRPRIAFVMDNTDNFMNAQLLERLQPMVEDLKAPEAPPRLKPFVELQVVEVYPYIEYVKYLLPGSITMAIFVVAMIGGGIVFIDDKARGLHEGYLVTPIHKAELILGLTSAGAIKGLMAGMVLTIIGSLIAGIPEIWNPMRLFYLTVVVGASALAMLSLMFLLMIRVSDPLVPRAIFGVLNTLLFFPSGAISPVEGFPVWLRWVSIIDPFTYSVHALRSLLLKNTGFTSIAGDTLVLLLFSSVAVGGCIALFKRQL